jgi:hypothetical protein
MIARMPFCGKQAVSGNRHIRDIARERPVLGKAAIAKGFRKLMEVPMFIQLTITVFVAAYIAIVAVGHVLLVAAVLRYMREGFTDNRLQTAAAGRATPHGETKRLSVRSPTKYIASQERADIAHRQGSVSRESPLLNFAERRQALDCDLRYVVTVTGSQC